MENALIAVISLIEGPLAAQVREFWGVLKDQYGASSVQVFEHPSVTLQGGTITAEKLELLRANFHRFVEKVHPLSLRVRALGHIEQHSLYFKVEQDPELMAVNVMVNTLLSLFCEELMGDYSPERYRPHIALAMGDLTEPAFQRAWHTFGQVSYQYDAPVTNLCLVRFEEDGALTLLERVALGE